MGNIGQENFIQEIPLNQPEINKNQKSKKYYFFVSLIVLIALAMSSYILFHKDESVQDISRKAAVSTIGPSPSPFPTVHSKLTKGVVPAGFHILGGFSGGSYPALVSSLGLTSVLSYGYNPVAGDKLSVAFNKYGLKMIDDMPDVYIRKFKEDGDMNGLLASMTEHLKSVQNNQAVIAYWMIDDWESNYGGAKIALQKMNALIHQYTPGKYSICGFSGNSNVWMDAKVANFSPEGCDMVGIYLYPYGLNKPTMDKNMPRILASLANFGWNIKVTPLVGIPQSYGGKYKYYIPSAEQVRAQTKSFCQYGATGIIYFDFHNGVSAATSSAIQQGIKSGIADCKEIWGR